MEVQPDLTSSTTGSRKKNNKLLNVIQKHYSSKNPCKLTPEELKKSEWLLPGFLRFNRWFLIPAAILIEFCAGSLYSFSVLNHSIDSAFDPDSRGGDATIAFYICVGSFGFTCGLLGPFIDARGPKVMTLFGNVLFFCGNLLSALAIHLPCVWLFYFGYGILSGIGLGVIYICPVSCLQKSFPDRRGLVSGLAVCGFGMGAMAFSKIQPPLIDLMGLPLTFATLGCFYFIVVGISALVLRNPVIQEPATPESKDSQDGMFEIELGKPSNQEILPKAEEEEEIDPVLTSLTSKDFALLYIAFISNCLFGLLVISRLSNMITDFFENTDPSTITTIVAINGAFNMAGRLVFAYLSDFLGRRNVYFILLTLQLIIIGVFPLVNSDLWLFSTLMWIITGACGGGVGVMPPFLSDLFGSEVIGTLYGIMMTGWALAGLIGGLVFTGLFDLFSGAHPEDPKAPYNLNMYWLFTIVLIGLVANFFVSPTHLDQKVCPCPRARNRSNITFKV